MLNSQSKKLERLVTDSRWAEVALSNKFWSKESRVDGVGLFHVESESKSVLKVNFSTP